VRLGSLQPRRHRPRTRPIEQYREFIEGRGPEVVGNGMLHRELVGLGFTGSYQQIQRYLKPYRAQRKMGGAGDDAVRDRARRTGAGRLRPAPGVALDRSSWL
jgi:hypothetical protein